MNNFFDTLLWIIIDFIIIFTTGILSLLIYTDFDIASTYIPILFYQLPIFLIFFVLLMYFMGLYNHIWRYASIKELLELVLTIAISISVWYGYTRIMHHNLPIGVYIIMFLMLMPLVGAARLSPRIQKWIDHSKDGRNEKQKKVLIVGAGDAGMIIIREMYNNQNNQYKIVGIIDDNKDLRRHSVHGVKVLGGRDDIPKIVSEYSIDEIIIAIPSVSHSEQIKIASICKKTKAKTKIVPGVYEIINGTFKLNDLKDIEIEDLLGRDPVILDNKEVIKQIHNKTCLITGAGGSIGSEICRQLLKAEPKELILLGKGENSIYTIAQELSAADIPIQPVIADIRDRERIRSILEKYKPNIVFHAAAHKHVPLMEYEPIEAIKNNVLGTKVLAEEVDKAGCEAFVMISTDKAVNPTSVMGASKRVAEMFVQSMNSESNTRYVVVRFGNVLGSRGSVVPLFKKQVAQGGPLTVTHKDMKRYFMTIPEASRLVLQAGAMAEGGEVFVLDMGEPVYIKDLAETVIRLSGYEPYTDIDIVYTGLRPGEKLFEELLSAEDGTEKTKHEKIFTARIKNITKSQMDKYIELLLSDPRDEMVVKHLQEVVPTYTPNRLL